MIFDSGLGVGSGTLSWNLVQPAVAQFTRACSYDRAGSGFSDPGPLPRSSDAVVSDLHALLDRAGIPPPYVLVGHSIAGLYAPLFADRYPSDVAAMVLVDPSAPGQEELFSSQFPRYQAYEAAQSASLHKCADDPVQPSCVPQSDPQLSATLNAAIAEMLRKSGAWADPASEFDSVGKDSTEVNGAAHGFGSMPLIVLTSTANFKTMQGPMGATNAQVATAQAGWITLHDRLVAQSTRGVNCVVPDAGHFIQTDRPDVVIDAIRQVIMLQSQTTAKPTCPVSASPASPPKPTPRRSRS
ncbi:MAG TPA: alpha/beta hydrolase [Candidatus Aquilonibacter sp.]